MSASAHSRGQCQGGREEERFGGGASERGAPPDKRVRLIERLQMALGGPALKGLVAGLGEGPLVTGGHGSTEEPKAERRGVVRRHRTRRACGRTRGVFDSKEIIKGRERGQMRPADMVMVI